MVFEIKDIDLIISGNQTLSNRVITHIIMSTDKITRDTRSRPNKVYISNELLNALDIFRTSQLRFDVNTNTPTAPYGYIAGISFYVTKDLIGMTYFVGENHNDIEKYYRKEKLTKIMNNDI